MDVQISLDGATAEVNDAVRGEGSYATALTAMATWPPPVSPGFKISVVVTRQNVGQLDEFKALADRFGAQLRLTRLRPSGRGADVWDELHPTAAQQRELYDWLVARGEQVLTGDSFFHLAAFGSALPGLNLCGAGRVVCLIDPVGDVYACPFAIHDNFLAGNVREPGGFAGVWRDVGAVHRAAPAAGWRRLHILLGLRRLPGRLHGGQVLHRPAPGRPGPGVRQGPRRARPAEPGHHHRRAPRPPATTRTAPARPVAREPAARHRSPSAGGHPIAPATRTRWPAWPWTPR